jgi:oligopeptide transport system ATP-binding protein
MTESLLEVRNLVREFHTNAGVVQAVSGVSFDVRPGETLGIVGETGSGKSTLARSVLQAPRPTSGEVIFRGTDLTTLRGTRLLQARRHLQMVFQDPFGSLDPKWTVRDLVEEPLIAYKTGNKNERRQRVDEVLELVGLDPASHGRRRPRELSGGQAQRVAIARAVALNPALIVCDEAVSSLDVLIQAQVLNLFERLRAELGLSYLFIAHDLALVKQVSDRVAVMYLGRLCEAGPGEGVYTEPLHPYTRALLDSVPSIDKHSTDKHSTDKHSTDKHSTDNTTKRAATTISGEPPSPVRPPSGCRFRTRCPRAQEVCAAEQPPMRELPAAAGGPGSRAGHTVACHFPLMQAARTTVRSAEKIEETPR